VRPRDGDNWGAAAVHWTPGVERWVRDQDEQLAAALAERGVDAHPAFSGFLNDPVSVRSKAGAPFRVYAAFRRAIAGQVGREPPLPAPRRLAAPAAWPASERLDDWRLHPTAPDWSTGFTGWTPGEDGARARLHAFLAEQLARYGERRNLPGMEGTTRLSPHLRFGEITPNQIVAAERAEVAANPDSPPPRTAWNSR
jgi:deoxyribodipyrimidine photo-lyase